MLAELVWKGKNGAKKQRAQYTQRAPCEPSPLRG